MKRVSAWMGAMALATTTATVLFAQPPALDVKMGLWEVTSTTNIGGDMPPVDTSKMTPQQKAQVEQAMKGMMGSHTNTTKSCMTREKFEKESFMIGNEPNQNCRQTLTTNTRSAFDAT